MKKVKVCLIGSGRAGMIHARNMAGSVPGGEIMPPVTRTSVQPKPRQRSLELRLITRTIRKRSVMNRLMR